MNLVAINFPLSMTVADPINFSMLCFGFFSKFSNFLSNFFFESLFI